MTKCTLTRSTTTPRRSSVSCVGFCDCGRLSALCWLCNNNKSTGETLSCFLRDLELCADLLGCMVFFFLVFFNELPSWVTCHVIFMSQSSRCSKTWSSWVGTPLAALPTRPTFTFTSRWAHLNEAMTLHQAWHVVTSTVFSFCVRCVRSSRVHSSSNLTRWPNTPMWVAFSSANLAGLPFYFIYLFMTKVNNRNR